MELNQQLSKISQRMQVSEYEKIIQQINEKYELYKARGIELASNIDSKIDYCLQRGTDAISFYLPDYYNTPHYRDTFGPIEEKLLNYRDRKIVMEKRVFSLINTRVSYIEKYLKDSNDPRYNSIISIKEKIEDMKLPSELSNILYLRSINSVVGDIIEQPYVKTVLFQALSSMNTNYSTILSKIHPNIDKYLKNNVSIYNAIDKALSDEKFSLSTSYMLDLLVKEIQTNTKKDEELKTEISKEFEKSLVFNMITNYTKQLKDKYKSGIESGENSETVLKNLIPDAYGIVKLACEVTLGIKPYDVQLMGALSLNDGKVSEMYTGEGKTITAIFAAYLNALTGNEVDIFTPNDYLAERDAKNNKSVFEILGLSVGCVKIDGQSLEEKQQEYKKDIVYGSSTAFAFDFLSDTNEKSLEYRRQRVEKPGFVIVDEADQVLINNAITPYILSGSKKLTKQRERENKQVRDYLEDAYQMERRLSQRVYYATTKQEFDAITGGNKKVTDEVNDKYSIVVLQETTTGAGDVIITKRGYNEIFYLNMKEEIDELSQKCRTYIEESNEYIDGVDYKLQNGKIILTMTGLEKASNNINEFFDLRFKWDSDEECLLKQKYINNAIKAQYLMEKGITYQVGIDPDTHKEVVKVLQDGRIIPNSKFSDGLHEAIMLKEGLSIDMGAKDDLLDDELASISNRALLSRYSKISGMTGTADKSAFYDIYGMDTFSVPRNKEYMYNRDPLNNSRPIPRNDKPMVLCKTKKDKYNAIINEIIESNKKGQPILVTTNSIEEAEYFYNIISNMGFASNLLIADRNLEEENQIIANAGKAGAITIATEMAGRGTDIKLGGIQKKEEILGSVLSNMAISYHVSKMLRNGKIDFSGDIRKKVIAENPELIQDTYKKYVHEYKTDEEFKKNVDAKVERVIQKNIDSIKSVGGLNYIQMTPFKTSRNDMQGKGRVGRQGEPGSTVIYTSLEELPNLGVERDRINLLGKLMNDKTVIDDEYADGVISSVVESAQFNNEYGMDMEIAQSDTFDLAISSYKMRLYNYKKEAYESNDLSVGIDNMTYKVITELIRDNVELKKQKKVDKDNVRISKLGLDIDTFLQNVQSIFGVNIDSESILSICANVGDLKDTIMKLSNERRKELEIGVPKEKVSSQTRDAVIKYANQSYDDFIYFAQDVKHQMFNDQIVGNTSHNRLSDLSTIYRKVKIESYKNTLKTIYRTNTNSYEYNADDPEISRELDYIKEENIDARENALDVASAPRK